MRPRRTRTLLVCADGANSLVDHRGEPIEALVFTAAGFTSIPGSIPQRLRASRPYMCMPTGKSHYRFEFMVMPDDDVAELLKPETAWRFMEPWFKPGDVEIVRHIIYAVDASPPKTGGMEESFWPATRSIRCPLTIGQGMCSECATSSTWRGNSTASCVASPVSRCSRAEPPSVCYNEACFTEGFDADIKTHGCCSTNMTNTAAG